MMVDVEFVERLDGLISLEQLKSDTKLEGMAVTRRGQRLSIQPVERSHMRHILKLGGTKTGVTDFDQAR